MIGLALLFLMVININNIFNNQIPLITSQNKKNDEQKREKGKRKGSLQFPSQAAAVLYKVEISWYGREGIDQI